MSGARARWAMAGAIVAVFYLWAWFETPVRPDGGTRLVTPFMGLVYVMVPPGVILAVLAGRLAPRHRWARGVAWVATFLYGLWSGAFTAWLATTSGELFCEPPRPPCVTDWGPRGVAIATTALVIALCLLIEERLSRRFPSEPS